MLIKRSVYFTTNFKEISEGFIPKIYINLSFKNYVTFQFLKIKIINFNDHHMKKVKVLCFDKYLSIV